MRIETARTDQTDVVRYLKIDVVRNALDLWYLERKDRRHKLYICFSDDQIIGHLGIYDTPEAVYANLGGEMRAAEELLHLIPTKRAAITTTKELGALIMRSISYDVVYFNDIMLVNRGEEKLRNPDKAIRLSSKNAVQYSSFGSSFNVPTSLPIDWINECLERDLTYGVFADDGTLASVASLTGWHDQVSVIMGVETKPEFRHKGFGAACVSAAVRAGLERSNSCSLFVRADNDVAIKLYEALGFKKIGEELWIDIGSGLIP
ncbi:MAG: GNAT family N-acetyltransferase [Nitrososphaerota archaeon]|nr:GNAT family N-acetyltransferase [Nitrososphaerota archaeon]